MFASSDLFVCLYWLYVRIVASIGKKHAWHRKVHMLIRKGGLDYCWFYDQAIVHNIRDGCTMPKGPAGHLSRATRCREQVKNVSLRPNNAGRLHSTVYCCVWSAVNLFCDALACFVTCVDPAIFPVARRCSLERLVVVCLPVLLSTYVSYCYVRPNFATNVPYFLPTWGIFLRTIPRSSTYVYS